MNKPTTFSLFLASALLTSSLSFAQDEGTGDEGQNTVPGQQSQQPAPKGEPNEGQEPGKNGDDDAFPVTLEIKVSEDEAYAQVSLDEESFKSFFAAIVIAKSDATGDINDQQFLSAGQLAALVAGSGNKAEMSMPQGLSEDLYAQVWILDDEGQLWAGPVKKLSELTTEESGKGDS